jgi:hypothetical protein
MAKKPMTQAEKDSYDMFKKLLNKPSKLKKSDFTPGSLLMFAYNAKDKYSAYDGRPLCLVLRRSKGYTLGINFNWMPPKMREKVLDGIIKQNKSNIKKGLPITVNYSMVKKLIKGLGPVIRLYINKRISPKGVVVPSYQYYKVINLRSEHFIGISSKAAWAAAIAGKKAKKKAKIAAAKQRKIDAANAQARINKNNKK